MADQKITDAATRAIEKHVVEITIESWSPSSEAVAVLAVVEPLIRDQIAKEIESARNRHWQERVADSQGRSSSRDYAIHDTFLAAAEIVRGGDR